MMKTFGIFVVPVREYKNTIQMSILSVMTLTKQTVTSGVTTISDRHRSVRRVITHIPTIGLDPTMDPRQVVLILAIEMTVLCGVFTRQEVTEYATSVQRYQRVSLRDQRLRRAVRFRDT